MIHGIVQRHSMISGRWIETLGFDFVMCGGISGALPRLLRFAQEINSSNQRLALCFCLVGFAFHNPGGWRTLDWTMIEVFGAFGLQMLELVRSTGEPVFELITMDRWPPK